MDLVLEVASWEVHARHESTSSGGTRVQKGRRGGGCENYKGETGYGYCFHGGKTVVRQRQPERIYAF